MNTLAMVFQVMAKPMSAFAITRKALKVIKQEGSPEGLRREVNERFKTLSRKFKKNQSRIVRFNS